MALSRTIDFLLSLRRRPTSWRICAETLADDRLGSSIVEVARTTARVGDDDDEEEEKAVAVPPRWLTVFDDGPRRDDIDLPLMDVADGVLAVVADDAADRSDDVDDVVEPPTNCWCLVVDDACCCCCDLMA